MNAARTLVLFVLCLFQMGAQAESLAQQLARRHVDFNADGKTDILFSHNGGFQIFGMDGVNQAGYTIVSWVHRLADFNGDGRTDLLQRLPDASYRIDLMSGLIAMAPGVSLGAAVIAQPSNWEVESVADFDGDGKADLLWRRTSDGAYGIWLMDGLSVKPDGMMGLGPPEVGYEVKLIADFDGDGKSDILWRHRDSGRAYVALMDGYWVRALAYPLPGLNNPWAPAMTGDFNGDGKADILWRTPDRRMGIWLMDGTAITPVLLPAVDSLWSFRYATDLDGNGTDDLVLSMGNAIWGAWLMDGGSVVGYTMLRTPAGGEAGVCNVGDFDADGQSDLMWSVRDQSVNDVWLMDGLSVATSGSVSANPDALCFRNSGP